MTYTIEKVTTLIGAHRFGATDANIGFLLTDSRSLCFAEETLFFALKSGRETVMPTSLTSTDVVSETLWWRMFRLIMTQHIRTPTS